MGAGALVAGGIAAVGAIGGAVISSQAAKSAASTQAAAADRASQAAQAQYAQTRSDLLPYQQSGQTGLDALQASLGLGGPGTNLLAANGINSLAFQPTQAQLAATPGYQFDLAQGLQSVQNSNAAAGRGISGAAMKGAANYATGLANNTLTTQQGIFQQNLSNVLSPLQNLANVGQSAAAQTGQQGLQATANSNAALVGGANAQAAGTVGSANAISGGLSSLGNIGLNYTLYNQMLRGSTPNTGTSNIDTTSGWTSP